MTNRDSSRVPVVSSGANASAVMITQSCRGRALMVLPMVLSARSGEGEQRREDDHDRRRPDGEGREVGRLPSLDPVEAGARREESDGELGGAGEVDEKPRG